MTRASVNRTVARAVRRNGHVARPTVPLVSVITPVHAAGTPYLAEAWASLTAQTWPRWEWVLLTNHGGTVPPAIAADPRVVVHAADPALHGVGALKQRACQSASGAWFVELDADDLLVPDALAQIVAAFGRADVVYSDFAEFHTDTWAPNTYSAAYGWASYPMDYQGHALTAMAAPPVTPQNLRFIDWAPNHVRAWTRRAYEAVGGHDSALPFADDHDLLVRGFLAGHQIARIPAPLYLYRVHPANHVATHNTEIRQWTNVVYNRHVWALAMKGARDAGLALVDLCGAEDTPSGFVPLDVRPTPGGIVADLRSRWPLSDGSVGVLRAHDAVEHLPDPVHTMNEAYRVLAPGGWLMIHVPATNGLGAFCDPTHVSYWNRLSFRYYTDRQFQRFIPKYTGRFQVSRLLEWFPSDWHRRENVPYVEAHLICLKDGYTPMGEVTI